MYGLPTAETVSVASSLVIPRRRHCLKPSRCCILLFMKMPSCGFNCTRAKVSEEDKGYDPNPTAPTFPVFVAVAQIDPMAIRAKSVQIKAGIEGAGRAPRMRTSSVLFGWRSYREPIPNFSRPGLKCLPTRLILVIEGVVNRESGLRRPSLASVSQVPEPTGAAQ